MNRTLHPNFALMFVAAFVGAVTTGSVLAQSTEHDTPTAFGAYVGQNDDVE